MAQLKDLLVLGPSNFIGNIQITGLNAPTTAGGTTYGLGTNGYALLSNGSSVYWGAISTDNYYHTSGSWGGTDNLTYTATANGGAGELALTLPKASTSAYGATKLSTATNSTATDLAATPSAVKSAYDLANSYKGTVTSITLIQGAGITLDTNNTAITASGSRTISITGMNTSTGSTTSVLSQKGTWVSLPTAESLGLSNAMHFIGITSTALSDGATTTTLAAKTTGSLTKTTGFVAGDVVIDTNSDYEYVWTGSAWEKLGSDSSYKVTQTAVTTATDNNTTNTRFVSGVTQDANGVITVVTELCPVVEVVRLTS